MNGEELFGFFCLWCAINTVLICFLFARASEIQKLKKEINTLRMQFVEVSKTLFKHTKGLVCEREIKISMTQLKNEGFLFPFDVYDFNSYKFETISKMFEDFTETFDEEYVETPTPYIILKELVLPFIRDEWKKEKFEEEFINFIKRHNMQKKENKQ